MLVGSEGTVTLIDCDSFQVANGTEVFTCDVGVPLFTAPELQGRAFRGLRRTEDNDRFGLAVLLFHLLYMGRHPYAGKYSGPGDMSIERAIGEFRFAYGPDRHANGMERPPGAISLETFGPAIAHLFQSAFSRSAATRGRPDAESWIGALGELGSALQPCGVADRHHYPTHLETCPWCAVEATTGANLFGRKVSATTTVVDLETLLQAITDVPGPGPAPALPSERPWSPPSGFEPLPKAARWGRKAVSVGIAGAGLITGSVLGTPATAVSAAVALGGAIASWPRPPRQKRAAAELASEKTRAVWDGLVTRWQREASGVPFQEKRKGLECAGAQLADLANERSRRLLQLDTEREARQLERYLDRFRITGANVTGIGPGRTSMLASYGIETAADIDRKRIASIPGFNRMLTAELVRWRRDHEANFRFNPNEPIDRRDIEAMDLELALRRQELLSVVREGPRVLRSLSLEIRAARGRLMPLLEDAWTALRLAEAVRDAL